MDDFKWVAILFIGVFASMAAGASICSWAEAFRDKAAIENGYEQIEMESGNVLWKPVQSR